MPITCYEDNKGFVLENFNKGDFDYIDAASEAEECEFFRFIEAKNYLSEFSKLYPSPRTKEEVETWFYIASRISMPLHGVQSYNAYPYVIRSGGMLNAFGFEVGHKAKHPKTNDTTLSCKGFNNKNDYDRQTPCDQDYLRKFSKDTDVEKLFHWFNHDIANIFKNHKVFEKDGIFIGDGTYIFVPDNEKYEGSVRLLFDSSGHPISQETFKNMLPEKAAQCEWKRCYKLVSLLYTNKERTFNLRVALRVVPGNEHECPIFYKLLEDFIENIGDGVVNRLILDRGFIDGERISWFKRKHGVDILIPLKKNMDLYKDVMGLIDSNNISIDFKEYMASERISIDQPRLKSVDVPERIRKRELKRQKTVLEKKEKSQQISPPDPAKVIVKSEVAGISNFTTWNSCTVPVNLIINRDTYASGETKIWILLDTKPFDGVNAPIERREEYAIRVEIEEGHRQLKCFWDLTKFTSRAFTLIVNQIIFVVLTYNLLQIWLKNRNKPKDSNEKEGQTETRKTRPRLLNQLLPTQAVIIIYYKNYYAMLAALEYTELLLNLSEQARRKVLEKTQRLRKTLETELELVRPA